MIYAGWLLCCSKPHEASDIQGSSGSPSRRPADRPVSVTPQILFQNSGITVLLPQDVGHQHTCIGPANGTVHARHVEVCAALRCDLGQAAVFRLPVVEVGEILLRKGQIVKEIACRGYERLLNCKMIFQLLYWAYQSFFGRTPQ